MISIYTHPPHSGTAPPTYPEDSFRRNNRHAEGGKNRHRLRAGAVCIARRGGSQPFRLSRKQHAPGQRSEALERQLHVLGRKVSGGQL